MKMKSSLLIAVSAVFLTLGSGCEKPQPPEVTLAVAPVPKVAGWMLKKPAKSVCLDAGAKDYSPEELAKAASCHMAYSAALERRLGSLQTAVKEMEAAYEAELERVRKVK